jgi:hypothetical protein
MDNTRLAEDSSVILIDLYKDGHGDPNLLLDTPSAQALSTLRKIFERFINRELTELRLTTNPTFAFTPRVTELILKLTEGADPTRSIEAADAKTLQWTRNPEGWLRCIDLIDGLIHPGHQYLECANDKINIVVSYQENSAESRLRHLTG